MNQNGHWIRLSSGRFVHKDDLMNSRALGMVPVFGLGQDNEPQVVVKRKESVFVNAVGRAGIGMTAGLVVLLGARVFSEKAVPVEAVLPTMVTGALAGVAGGFI